MDEGDQQQRAEWEANWFAGAFLMPREKFPRACQEAEIASVAQQFAISVPAVQRAGKEFESRQIGSHLLDIATAISPSATEPALGAWDNPPW